MRAATDRRPAWLLGELRAPAELGLFLGAFPLLHAAPRGRSRPVLVLPGFVAGDSSTLPLRALLGRLGHQPLSWGLGTNLGPTADTVSGLVRRLHEAAEQAGEPVSLVGWSLGGIYALLAAGKPLYVYVAMLLVVYAAVIVATALSMARIFLARLQAEADKDRQKQVVDLLLRDFEAHASDWLWEVDLAGRLRHVSVRLAEALGQPVAALQGVDFMEAIAAHAGAERQQSGARLAAAVVVPAFRRFPMFLDAPIRETNGFLWFDKRFGDRRDAPAHFPGEAGGSSTQPRPPPSRTAVS